MFRCFLCVVRSFCVCLTCVGVCLFFVGFLISHVYNLFLDSGYCFVFCFLFYFCFDSQGRTSRVSACSGRVPNGQVEAYLQRMVLGVLHVRPTDHAGCKRTSSIHVFCCVLLCREYLWFASMLSSLTIIAHSCFSS